jgi:formylglycine-generating enzyme required for sulfatase activity
MPKIFISYRRSDSEDVTGRIYDRLVAHFGDDAIFKDVDDIPFGADFRDYLNESLDQCQVVLAVIGNTLLTAGDGQGKRRLDNPADWVRLELEEALGRKTMLVVPLLVSRASLPRADDLPQSIANLAYRNSAQARPDPDFHKDMSRLIGQLEQYFGRLSQPAAPPTTTPPVVKPANPTFSFEIVTITGVEKGLLGLGAAKVITSRRQAQAEYLKENLGNGTTLDLVTISGGTFTMGSPAGEEGRDWYGDFDDALKGVNVEGPQHQVKIPPFLMGKYPVTQAQWKAVAAMPKSECDLESDPANFKGDNRPVEQVSWDDAVEFCQRLSKHTGREYRLPSEAEWEYACRAGTTTPFHFGSTITPDLANYEGNYTYGAGPKGKDREQTTDVGSLPPNALGLYDMHGNVLEWCLDHWHDTYEGAPTDGSAWLSSGESKLRLLRGGSWYVDPWRCRSAFRIGLARGEQCINIGFRLVCASSWAL